MGSEGDWAGRWNPISKLLERKSPLCPEFEPGKQNLENVSKVKVLVVGAGGLGSELLKDLALSGFRNIHVIDMDTIDISNLNRQFLFRLKDVGRPKAEVAAEFVNKRVAGCTVTPHYCPIQEKDQDFYKSFNLIICGLDSVVARRWINSMVFSLLEYDDDMQLVHSSIIPVVDGGTEGFLGNARVIIPTQTPCVECTINLYPPQVNYPMCTIAHTPRLPEHCVEYVRLILWEKEKPFGDGAIDGDDPKHLLWIFDKSKERAEQYDIKGVTYRLTQGVIKHIIPAVASTNAIIAASCALEAFKLASSCAYPMNNYMNFQQTSGVYVGVVELEKKEDCMICSQKPSQFTFSESHKLKDVISYLVDSAEFQMKSPSISVAHPTLKVLYQSNIPSLEQKTRPNLRLTLKELGLENGQEVYVADITTPQTVTFRLQIRPNAELDMEQS